VFDLPFAPLSRTISLTARKGVLQDMPAQVAERLKPLLRDIIVTPAFQAHPFMAGTLRLL